ncbi:hypothetical protein [Streptomyces sp. NPDC047009]|uniref:hypothetical protein n=1 Tax=unclassified Streptomyces TaxID=2593676 RepID=UPI00340413E8
MRRDLAALERHDLKRLVYAPAVLDDDRLVVLHRPSGTRFEVRIGGIGDNVQLDSRARCSPTSSSAAMCPALRLRLRASAWHGPRARPRTQRGCTEAVATGALELFAPDGERTGTRGCQTTSPWWRDAVCSCWTSGCITAVGVPTGSFSFSRVRPS